MICYICMYVHISSGNICMSIKSTRDEACHTVADAMKNNRKISVGSSYEEVLSTL